MLRRRLPVEYSYSIKDSFYLKMFISFFFFQKVGGGGLFRRAQNYAKALEDLGFWWQLVVDSTCGQSCINGSCAWQGRVHDKASAWTKPKLLNLLLKLGNSATSDFCLAMAAMDTLGQRRTLQSLIPFFKCFQEPIFISQFTLHLG